MSLLRSSCSAGREGSLVVDKLLISCAAMVEGGASKGAEAPFAGPLSRVFMAALRDMGAIMCLP